MPDDTAIGARVTVTRRWVGRAMPRREDARLVTGHGRFVDDVAAPGCLHLAFARSTEAHARLSEVDAAAARAVPGVIAVFTGADVAGLGDLPVNRLIEPDFVPPFPILAEDTVRAVGEPVAAVVAQTREAALEGAEAVTIDYDPLEPLTDPAAEGPALFAGAENNTAFSERLGTGDTDAAFAAADRTVSVTLDHPLVAAVSLEPRAALARIEGDGAMTVFLSTQTPNRARRDLAAIAGLSEAAIRVVAPDVGGAFGLKASLYPEEVLCGWAAWRLGRSVKWIATRGDDLLAGTHGRGAHSRAEAALDADGRFTALRGRIVCPLGHWMPFSGTVPARNAARMLPGPYAIRAVSVEAAGVLTTTAPVGIYRGAGRPEAAMLMERLADEAACAARLDPLEFRRRNLIPADAMPYRSAAGETYDSGDYRAVLDRACEVADWEALIAARDRRRAAGELAGVGLCVYVEPCGVGWERGIVRLSADGRFTVITGASAQGQGRETGFAQLAADALSVAPDRIEVVEGDTAMVPEGIGALASRGTWIGGAAVREAAERLRARARATAARLLQAHEDALEVGDDGIRTDGPASPEVDWATIARAMIGEDEAESGGFAEESVRFEAPGEAWSYGACIAAMSVERDTGVPTIERITWVDDAGVIVNPLLAEGQLIGGLAQGLGSALLERLIYDEAGQLLTGSLMDYAVPRADDMPPVTLDRIETPSPLNPLGAKGLGEAGCIGVPAAILNAAVDALSPLGVRSLDLPLTPETLWKAIQAAPAEACDTADPERTQTP